MKKLIILLFPVYIFSQDNNYSMSFNGVNQYVSFDYMNLPTGSNDRTIAFWVMPTGNSQNDDGGNIFSYGLGCSSCDNQRFSIIIKNDDWKIEIVGQNNDTQTEVSLDYMEWNFIAVSLENNQLKLFKNDSIVYIANLSTPLNTPGNTTFFLGKNTEDRDDEYFGGKIDNLHIWSYALSENELLEYKTCPPSGDEVGLVGFWNFNQGDSDFVVDISENGNGNYGVIYGSEYSDAPEQSCSQDSEETDSGLVGDVNCDGDITLFDAQMVVSILLEEWDELGVSNYDELLEIYPCAEGVGVESNSEALEEVLEVLDGMNNNSNSNQSNNKTLMYTIDGF